MQALRFTSRAAGSRGWTRTAALLLAVTVVVLAASASVALAAEVSVSNMKVSVWPEYDDPRVLVIYQADLDDSVQLPAEVTFNLPKGAEIGMACEVDPSGGHSCKPFQLSDEGDYQSLTYRVEAQRKIFFEYYYEAFPAGPGARSFDLSLLPAFPAAELTVEVQEPARSTGFVLEPAFPQRTQDSQGLVYHQQLIAAPAVGEPIDLAISYTKQDADPSVSPVAGADAPGPAAAGAGGSGSSLLIVVAVVGMAGLGLLGYRTFRPEPAAPRGRTGRGRSRTRSGPERGGPRKGADARRRTSGPRTASSGRPAGRPARTRTQSGNTERARGAKFCTDCGAGIGLDDRFCGECGHALQ